MYDVLRFIHLNVTTTATTTSSSDSEDNMPLTPDSKYSYRIGRAPIPPRQSPTSCRSQKQRGFHPYRESPSSFKEEHLGYKLLGRPFNDDNSSEPMSVEVGPVVIYSSGNI